LYLNNVGMVAADTTRTKYYIEALVKNKLLPNYVLFLLNDDNKLLPGQRTSALENKIIFLLKNTGVEFDIIYDKDVNSNKVIRMLASRTEEVFIFSGFGGALLNDSILDIGKKFLHVHGGYLPDYKGSTTNYYSLINDNKIGASAIFLTKEIDCGPILLRKKFLPPKNRSEIDHIYDSRVRTEVLIEVLKNYVISGDWSFELKSNKGGEVFYIIHPVLKHLSILGG
jgi:methionyl-tRNA formyltransferase